MTQQTTEQKKEEFRKYLERAGVIDKLTKVLVALYEDPDKSGNAIEKIKSDLGAPSDGDIEALKSENEELRQGNLQLQREVENLKSELDAEIAKGN